MLSEDEQLIVLKAWWKRYRYPLIIGLLVGIGVFGFWRMFEYKKQEQRLEASLAYQTVLESLAKNEMETAAAQTKSLNEAVMPYALMNQLLLARLNIEGKNWDKAITHLEWVAEQEDAYFSLLASVRLARLYLLQSKADAALKVLQAKEAAATQYPDWFVAKAQALAALQKLPDARAAYTSALALYPPESFLRQITEMELANIPKE